MCEPQAWPMTSLTPFCLDACEKILQKKFLAWDKKENPGEIIAGTKQIGFRVFMLTF